jgi:hypothetical protein
MSWRNPRDAAIMLVAGLLIVLGVLAFGAVKSHS